MTLSACTALDAHLLGQMADTLAWPLLVLRDDATLVHANLAARRLLAGGQPLRQTADGRLCAADAARQAAWTDALAAAARQRQRGVLRWAGAGGSPGASLTLAPLPGGRNRDDIAADGGAVPVLLAITLADNQAADLPAFAAQRGLSTAEGRLLPRLALADSSAQAAAALGLAPATVRRQTASLRRKTGHRSVADLVRAIALLPPTAVMPAPAAAAEAPVLRLVAGLRGLRDFQVNPDLQQHHG